MSIDPITLSNPGQVHRLIAGSQLLAIDLETAGPPGRGMDGALNPREGRIRLLQLHDGQRGVVIDVFEHPIQQFLPALESKILLAHHAGFDLGFLWHAGMRNLPETVCTFLLAQLLTAGEDYDRGFGRCSLAACCQRYLGLTLPKELQTSDWSGTLSTEQLEYALNDVAVLPKLFLAMGQEIEKAGLTRVSEIELQCLPTWVWMLQSGVRFDQDGWLALAEQAEARKEILAAKLASLAPLKAGKNLFGDPAEDWNWSSPNQVKDVLGQLGFDVTTSCDAQLALIDHDFAVCLRDFREQEQRLKMYGPNWMNAADLRQGRLYPDWRQIGTVTGRTTCKKPNCQQIPRGGGYRRCFQAAPDRILVKCDYSQLQMRLACRWAQDTALLHVFQQQEDTHTSTARMLTGKATPSKVERQIAKSANFLLTFAGSAEALRVYCSTNFGLRLTKEEAEAHRNAFFSVYRGLKAWHNRAFNTKSTEIRSRLGRRRIVPSNVVPTERLNTPCQADESDGAKLALGLLWKRRAQCPDAVPVLFNHDELVLECPLDQAAVVESHLRQCMLDAMTPILDPVPTVVESKVCQSWEG